MFLPPGTCSGRLFCALRGLAYPVWQTSKGGNMRRVLVAAIALTAVIPLQAVADDDISGTYKLVVDQRKIVDTGEVVDVPNPSGYIMYDKGGRMMVVIVRQPRPRPQSSDKVTDQERIDLYKSLSAYGGTYKFDGKTVEHSVDIAWN